MGESQSRYGIMEELNQKKIKTRGKLAVLEKESSTAEMQVNDEEDRLKKEISEREATFENEHQSFIRNKEMEINGVKRDLEIKIESLKGQIEDSENNYKEIHEKTINELNNKLSESDKYYLRFKKLKELDKKAIEDEIKEIEGAIDSLKELSKEQK